MSNQKFNLLRQVNEQTEQQINEEQQLSEVDSTSSENDIKAKFNSISELQKIANDWKDQADELSDEELREKIGYDLEQLEYTPEQQAEAIPKIIDMIKQ